jgi:hypothetical protein
VIRVIPPRLQQPRLDPAERLRLFDEATERQRARQSAQLPEAPPVERGWKREDLYTRGSAG